MGEPKKKCDSIAAWVQGYKRNYRDTMSRTLKDHDELCDNGKHEELYIKLSDETKIFLSSKAANPLNINKLCRGILEDKIKCLNIYLEKKSVKEMYAFYEEKAHDLLELCNCFFRLPPSNYQMFDCFQAFKTDITNQLKYMRDRYLLNCKIITEDNENEELCNKDTLGVLDDSISHLIYCYNYMIDNFTEKITGLYSSDDPSRTNTYYTLAQARTEIPNPVIGVMNFFKK